MGVEAARTRRAARRPRRRGRRALVLDRRSRRTSTRRTPPRSTPRCGSTRTAPRSTSAARSARASVRCGSRSTGPARRSSSPPTCAPACPPAPTSRPGATARPRCSSATTPTAPVIAEYLGSGAATEEFLDRWRTPGDRRSKVWEERFGETKYVPLGEQAWNAALKAAELTPDAGRPGHRHRPARPGRAGTHEAARRSTTARVVDDLAATVGNTGTAHPGSAARERARAGRARRR